MHRQREELIRQHHSATEQRDLLGSMEKEASELEKLIKEAAKDKKDVETEIRAIAEALQERADRLSVQLGDLDSLT